MVAVAVLLSVAIIEGSTASPQYDDYDPFDVPTDQAAPSQGENQCLGTLHIGSQSGWQDDSLPDNHQNTISKHNLLINIVQVTTTQCLATP